MDALASSTVDLLALNFDNAPPGNVVEMLLARDPAAPFSYVVTPNANHFSRLRRIPDLHMVYRAAVLCLLDSQLIGIIARLLKLPCPHVVTGADLTRRLLARLDGQRVAVIGMQAAEFEILQREYPGIIFLHYLPPMNLLHDRMAFRCARDFAISVSAPFTFIALGSPVQELLAFAIVARRSGTGIGLCIGAGLQFAAGTAQRAPRWMQHLGLEWLHRLLREPLRLTRRYLLDDPVVLLDLVILAIRRRRT